MNIRYQAATSVEGRSRGRRRARAGFRLRLRLDVHRRKGVVGGANFTPPVFADTAAASSSASTAATVYAGATVCFDLNGNGACDAGEPTTTTSPRAASGSLARPWRRWLPRSAPTREPAPRSRNVFRVNAAQIQAATKSPCWLRP
jgi:hypothetical protein